METVILKECCISQWRKMTVHQKWPFTVGIHFSGGLVGLFCVGKITIKSLPNSFTLWKLVFFCKLEISYISSAKQFCSVASEIKYFVGLAVELCGVSSKWGWKTWEISVPLRQGVSHSTFSQHQQAVIKARTLWHHCKILIVFLT